jgi:hypothetical protein
LDASDAHALLSDPTRFASAISNGDSDLAELLTLLDLYCPTASLTDAKALIVALGDRSNLNNVERGADIRVARAAGSLIKAIVVNVAQDERVQLTLDAIHLCSASLSHDVVLAIAHEHKLWTRHSVDPNPLPVILPGRSEAEKIVDAWLKRVVDRNNAKELVREPSLLAVLYRWGQLGRDWVPVHEAVREIIHCQAFLGAFVDLADSDGPFSADLRSLDIIGNRDELVRAIQQSSDLPRSESLLRYLAQDGVKAYFADRDVSRPAHRSTLD